MRVYPECVYLRLEPSLHIMDRKTGSLEHQPGVELHWKDGNKWKHRTFVANETAPTLGAVLGKLGEWLDSCKDLDEALAKAAP